MKRLLGTEVNGALVTRDWMHWGDDGKLKITSVTTQDAAPIVKKAKHLAEHGNTKDSRYLGSVPLVMLDDFCQKNAKNWGMKPREVMRELLANKTDRAKAFWVNQLKGRDFRKLQAKGYQ